MPSPTPPPLSQATLPKWAEGLAVVGAWGLVGAATVVRRALGPGEPPLSLHTVAVSAVEVAPWVLATPLVFWLARRVPAGRSRWAGRLAVHLAAAMAVVVAVVAVQRVAIPALGPPAGLVTSLPPPPASQPGGLPPAGLSRASPGRDGRGDRGGRGGPPVLPVPVQLATYLVVLGVGLARGYALQLRDRQDEAERLRDEAERLAREHDRVVGQLAEARLDALRMQLNPHFLFNALNAVSALAGDDPDGVRRVVARLSSLLRRVIDAPADAEVPLADELAFLRDYLDIQQVRFEGRLVVQEDIAPEAFAALLPAFLLQPLVENAVEHGADSENGGRVALLARVDAATDRGGDRRLVVTVRDDGPGPGTSTPAERVGLSNTRARIAALAGPTGALVLREALGGGFEAEVTLPYRHA